MKILVMNGPNINFLGIREKGIYGEQNYEALVSMIEKKAEELGVDVEVFQSNHEGAIIIRFRRHTTMMLMELLSIPEHSHITAMQ